MANVSMKTDIDVTPDKLWETIGGFHALPDWHPAVEKSEEEDGGTVRKLSLVGGGTIVERLISSDDKAKVYQYRIEDSPLPVANYVSTLKVTEGENGKSELEWSSEFDPKGVSENEAVKAVQDIYTAGFESLRKMFGG